MLFCHLVITVCACTFVTCTLIKINQSILGGGKYSAVSGGGTFNIAVQVSLAFGLTYTAAVYSARTVSDAHINPGVTVAMLTTRRISFARGALYLAAQLSGAVVGAAIALLFGDVPASSSPAEAEIPFRRAPTGCTVPGRHVTESQAFTVEFLASFFLVFVVFACYDKSSRSEYEGKVRVKVKEREHPFVIGLTYSGVLLFAVS